MLVRDHVEAGPLEHGQGAGEGRLGVDRLAGVDGDRVGLEDLDAAAASVGDRGVQERAPDALAAGLDETAKHTIDQTGSSSIVGMTRDRTMRS